MENREFDIILFGATGYTGRYVIEELALCFLYENFKWAVAGRDVQKLQDSLKIVQQYLGEKVNILGVTIIEADVKNAASISNMCKRARVLLNCVGPYKFYGEPIVKACIENGTHHLDLSGEPKFLEITQAKYFDAAQSNKVYVVQACGFESIPSDYGIALLKKNFSGELNSVDNYVNIGKYALDYEINSGTFVSGIHSMSDAIFTKESDKLLKESVFKTDQPQIKYPVYWRLPPVFYDSDFKSWYLWLVGPEPRILERSQMFSYEYLNERPVQTHGYLQMRSFFTALSYVFCVVILSVMGSNSFGRYLLFKFPSFFTFGGVKSNIQTKEKVKDELVTFTLCGKGWKDKLANPTDQHATKPDTNVKLTITAPVFAYTITAICMVQAGLTVLHECDKMPLEGGVLTPGVAFVNTSLQQRLEKRGMKFKFEL